MEEQPRALREAGRAEESRKWFQVTRRSARFPAGMHDRNLAFGTAGCWRLAPRRRYCPAAPHSSAHIRSPFPVEACLSMRPFTLLQRILPCGEGPRPGRRFRPAPSKPSCGVRPVRSAPRSRPSPAFYALLSSILASRPFPVYNRSPFRLIACRHSPPGISRPFGILAPGLPSA